MNLKEAKRAMSAAIAIESKHAKSYGGQRHEGAVHPLLNDDNFPLPAGWRKP